MSFSTTEIIEIVGIVTSLITSIVAIAISVLTLKQNSKMIEESSRPYVCVYTGCVYINSPSFYLIVKNFGQSGAFITSFTYDIDIAKFVNTYPREPFENIDHSFLAPGQAYRANINLRLALEEIKAINFHIEYSSGTHKYEEDFCINLEADLGNFVSRSNTPGKELKTISQTLQEINLNSL